MSPTPSSLLSLILAISTLVDPSQSSSVPGGGGGEFVRTSCSSTLYPALCFASLSPYAAAIGNDPLKLSQYATLLSLSRLRSASSHLSYLSLASASASPLMSSSPERRTVARAIRDCAQVLGSAADRTKDSVAELKKLKGTGPGMESRWCLSNVQTWMSAALTNEETCTDGLEEVGVKKSVAADVGGRVGVAKEFTSVALALVNQLATGS